MESITLFLRQNMVLNKREGDTKNRILFSSVVTIQKRRREEVEEIIISPCNRNKEKYREIPPATTARSKSCRSDVHLPFECWAEHMCPLCLAD